LAVAFFQYKKKQDTHLFSSTFWQIECIQHL
jgi:hypothetical protein